VQTQTETVAVEGHWFAGLIMVVENAIGVPIQGVPLQIELWTHIDPDDQSRADQACSQLAGTIDWED
jgi:hypothetical protein